MTLIIRRLQETFPELPLREVEQNPLNWTFRKRIKKLGPDFYKKVILQHLVLNLEYSFLCQQISNKFLSRQLQNQDELIKQLIAALMLAELLEHVYQDYLIVPREVERLRQQQALYRELLAGIIAPLGPLKPLENSPSFSQDVHNTTINLNLHRLLFIRSKRALDLIALLGTSSETYRNFVKILDKCTAPFLQHLAWFFYLPRFLVNLFLTMKHTIPHPWMGEKEKSLGVSVRFQAQMQRRWFELGNDFTWVTVGLIIRFYLTGVLAPVGAYLSIACFAFDVLMSLTRAYIELSRLYKLQKQYIAMKNQTSDINEQQEIDVHLNTIENQLNFEKLRLGSHLATTTTIFLAMCCSAPLFAAAPFTLLLASTILVLICFINFTLMQMINESRPKDTIEIPSGITKLGLFAKKEPAFTESFRESQEFQCAR